ncbi:MAG: hypothetical protein M3481_10575, partial [Actinomycetota bacterium]|nr:hypothetical protein [Actinomycetota bacterium]
MAKVLECGLQHLLGALGRDGFTGRLLCLGLLIAAADREVELEVLVVVEGSGFHDGLESGLGLGRGRNLLRARCGQLTLSFFGKLTRAVLRRSRERFAAVPPKPSGEESSAFGLSHRLGTEEIRVRGKRPRIRLGDRLRLREDRLGLREDRLRLHGDRRDDHGLRRLCLKFRVGNLGRDGDLRPPTSRLELHGAAGVLALPGDRGLGFGTGDLDIPELAEVPFEALD